MALVLDIECVGLDWESDFDDEDRKHLVKRASRLSDNPQQSAKDELALSPFTGKIVSIAFLDTEKNKKAVYFDANGEKIDEEIDGVRYRSGNEAEILELFWTVAKHYTTFVTFYGRGFDLPYLVIRSAVNEIRPPIDLMTSRYIYQQRNAGIIHVDLLEQFTNYSSFSKIGSLHMACKAFGIETPKDGDIDGSMVGEFYANGKYRQIAQYNMRDVIATAKLYQKWQKYLQF